jgi:predicted TPR repeat methyltransferase
MFNKQRNLKAADDLLALAKKEQEVGNNIAAGKYAMAILSMKPKSAEAYYILAMVQFNQGCDELAIELFEKAISLKPQSLEYNYALAALFLQVHQYDKAEYYFKICNELKSTSSQVQAGLGNVYLARRELSLAKFHYEKAHKLDPQNKQIKHLYDSLNNNTTDTAPREYIESLFDQYATYFEAHLSEKLEYKVPSLIAEIAMNKLANKDIEVLDLGCGTGLIGKELFNRRMSARIIGVDLSMNMLEEAKKRANYIFLHHKDVLEFVKEDDHVYDLITAGDIFVYIGKLDELFLHIGSIIKPNGLFIFSVENTDEEGYVLSQCGRYKHSEEYIMGLIDKYNLRCIDKIQANLRVEFGQGIKGDIYTLAPN